MYNVIQKHKNNIGIWLFVACFALIFCLMCDKDTLEATRYYQPDATDYALYFGPRILLLISVCFAALQFKKMKAAQKFLKDNTVRISKIIHKGKVIAKDSKSTTTGNSESISTSHSYTTSIRLLNINQPVYFYDKHTYMNCSEGEDVGVLISYNVDKDDKVLATRFDFMGNYEQYQRVKDEYVQRNPHINPDAKNIPWNEYIIR